MARELSYNQMVERSIIKKHTENLYGIRLLKPARITSLLMTAIK